MKKNKKPKILRWILLLFLIIIFYNLFFVKSFNYQNTIIIKDGDNFQTFLSDFGWKNKLNIKYYVKKNHVNMNVIAPGTYTFYGKYSPKTFVDLILDGPQVEYHTIRILEGWSIYDIDDSLANKGIINKGEYIDFVQDPTIISRYQERYEFLPKNIKILEGFLYPDTYKVDMQKYVIDQLVYLQLDTFKKRVWDKVSTIATPAGMDWYKSIIMASIVEKEEKSEANRPIVAGILIKRLQIGMLVGADISLCYFHKIPYSDCTPNFIARNVSDKSNPYNTRAVLGLPPTPVGNPTYSSIIASLQPKYTDYLYYLHDKSGQIHYAKNLDQHNTNKNNYLK